jgi:hypothetical protein
VQVVGNTFLGLRQDVIRPQPKPGRLPLFRIFQTSFLVAYMNIINQQVEFLENLQPGGD